MGRLVKRFSRPGFAEDVSNGASLRNETRLRPRIPLEVDRASRGTRDLISIPRDSSITHAK